MTGGRSWYRGKVTTTETCCPPEITDASALKTALMLWVDNTVNTLPYKGRARPALEKGTVVTKTEKVKIN
jgi:hypothetical protein